MLTRMQFYCDQGRNTSEVGHTGTQNLHCANTVVPEVFQNILKVRRPKELSECAETPNLPCLYLTS